VVRGAGRAAAVATFVLSYDHGLLDGWEAAAFLECVRQKLTVAGEG